MRTFFFPMRNAPHDRSQDTMMGTLDAVAAEMEKKDVTTWVVMDKYGDELFAISSPVDWMDLEEAVLEVQDIDDIRENGRMEFYVYPSTVYVNIYDRHAEKDIIEITAAWTCAGCGEVYSVNRHKCILDDEQMCEPCYMSATSQLVSVAVESIVKEIWESMPAWMFEPQGTQLFRVATSDADMEDKIKEEWGGFNQIYDPLWEYKGEIEHWFTVPGLSGYVGITRRPNREYWLELKDGNP